jgi:hypothetical protein
MNLVLAFLWLIGAVVLLAYEYFTGRVWLRILGTNLSASWLLIVLALYNFARWWGTRSYRKQQQALRIADAARERELRRREQPAPYDPTFDFTAQAPPPANPHVTDRPPPPDGGPPPP